MDEQALGRPVAGGVVVEQVWMPVKHAARAAGVPKRSAFRWAKKGVVPVRRSGKVQLVEVAALRAFAARPMNAGVAAAGATVATLHRKRSNPPTPPLLQARRPSFLGSCLRACAWAAWRASSAPPGDGTEKK